MIESPHNEVRKLQPHEVESPLWRKLEGMLTARLNSLRKQNDGEHDERRTAKLRGRIAEVKFLLALADLSAPEQEADDPESSA